MLPEIPTDPECHDDRKSEILFEEALGIVDTTAQGPDSDVELKASKGIGLVMMYMYV